ncbi:hypothetical protein [Runella sp.]|uniref:hypothetical protein n=1 Tax=Runella sp. TaxID=1960881 RepID=UPI0030178CDF
MRSMFGTNIATFAKVLRPFRAFHGDSFIGFHHSIGLHPKLADYTPSGLMMMGILLSPEGASYPADGYSPSHSPEGASYPNGGCSPSHTQKPSHKA